MKEIFEIDLKGNEGNTIKEIKSISKDTKYFDNNGKLDGSTSETTFIFEIVYHSGESEKIKIERQNGVFV